MPTRKIKLLPLLLLIAISLAAQNKDGFYTKSVPSGTKPPEWPLDESVRHKFVVSAMEDSVQCNIWFRYYEDGKYRSKSEREEYITQFHLAPSKRFSAELIPELHDENKMAKVFYLRPGGYLSISRFSTYSDEKQVKFIFYSYPTAVVPEMNHPILLLYEDDIKTNSNEKLLAPFIVNGKLKHNAASEKLLKEQFAKYNLFILTTK